MEETVSLINGFAGQGSTGIYGTARVATSVREFSHLGVQFIEFNDEIKDIDSILSYIRNNSNDYNIAKCDVKLGRDRTNTAVLYKVPVFERVELFSEQARASFNVQSSLAYWGWIKEEKIVGFMRPTYRYILRVFYLEHYTEQQGHHWFWDRKGKPSTTPVWFASYNQAKAVKDYKYLPATSIKKCYIDPSLANINFKEV